LHFDDGRPDADTAASSSGYLDTSRAMEAYLNNLGLLSTESLRLAHIELGATQCNHVLIAEQLVDHHALWLTGNTGTVDVFFMLDLERDGATVIEIPEHSGPGLLDDACMRWVIDFGPTGPDRGAGGTHVILPPDDDSGIRTKPGGETTTMNIGGVEKQVYAVRSVENVIIASRYDPPRPSSLSQRWPHPMKPQYHCRSS